MLVKARGQLQRKVGIYRHILSMNMLIATCTTSYVCLYMCL